MKRPSPGAERGGPGPGDVLMAPGSPEGPGLSQHRAFLTAFPPVTEDTSINHFSLRVVLTPHLRERLMSAHQIGFRQSDLRAPGSAVGAGGEKAKRTRCRQRPEGRAQCQQVGRRAGPPRQPSPLCPPAQGPEATAPSGMSERSKSNAGL